MKLRVFPYFSVAVSLLTLPLGAAQLWWDFAGTGTWGTNTNWSTAAAGGVDPPASPVAGDTANFNVTSLNSAVTVNLGGPQAVTGITQTSNSTVTLLGGGTATTLTIGTGGITTTTTSAGASTTLAIGSAATPGDAVNVILAGSQKWSYSGGTGTAGGAGILVNNTVSIADGGSYTLTLGGTVGNNPASIIAGVIGNGNGTLSLTMDGSSTNRWNLGGTNTYTGVTNITSGGLGITNVNALGGIGAGSGTNVAAGASLFLRLGGSGTNTVAAESITIKGTGIADLGALRSVTGTNVWTGTIAADTTTGDVSIGSDSNFTLSSAADITATGTNKLLFVYNGNTGTAATTVNGSITGAIGVTKGGGYTDSTLLFGGDTKAYTGATAINNGSFQLNTNLTATSAVNIAAGAKFSGNNSTINLAAPVTVNGTLAPGASFTTGVVGTMTMGALSLTPTSVLQIDINSGTLAKDLLNVSSLNLGGALAVNDLGASTLAIGQALLFIQNSGVWTPANGVFTVGGVAINNESETFTVGSNTFKIKYDYVNGGQQGVALVAVVPEPTGALLAALGAGAVLLRRRRR